jgi:glutamate--cysteine ligase
MRGADGGPWRDICALPAFWVGLMYSQSSLEAAHSLTTDWTAQDVAGYRAQVPELGLKARVAGRPLLEIAREVLDMSAAGLAERDIRNSSGQDERVFLAPLMETVASGLTPAERLLNKYHGAWEGDINRLFDEYAY